MDITPEAARTAALRFGEADADPKPLQAGLRDSCLAATGCDRWCKNLAARGLRAAAWWLPPSAVVALLACYQVHLASLAPATSANESDRAAEGTEVIIGVVQEPVFGPLVVFGRGRVASDLPADRAARLAPLTDADADELIRSIRAAPLLLGFRGSPPADLTALQDLLLRVSRLADDLPELAELDLNPVVARPGGVAVADARIRLAPAEPQDPFLRKLR